MRTYTLYLNTKTTTGFLRPTDKSNLNCVRWNVNWDALFPTSTNATRLLNNNAKCRVKAHLVSASSAAPVFSTHKGTLRISGLATSNQNPLSGVLLGYIKPVVNPTTAGQYYLECDTTQAVGVEISVPSNPNICVAMFDDTGTVGTVNALEYELILHFELEDDDTESKYNTNANAPPFVF